ncbi:MAG: HU family DNA-binding protein [Clostridiales bacterium]|nr:HU family DNA-binding protein [Clostridiales bacterium]
MNKQELITAIAEQSGLARKDADAAVKAFVEVVSGALKEGDRVQMIGFGTFEVSERGARTGRNPRSGETIEIAASRIPKFKAGKALRDLINE